MSDATVLQRVALKTNGVLTPANLLDAVAFAGAAWSGPRLDTWSGIVAGVASYVSDAGDGRIARATGTSTHVGELVDHIGDKPKVAYALYYIWTKRLADRRLVGLVAAYNAVTASITIYDRLSSRTSQVEVGKSGKRAMFATATGVGLQTIATKVAERHGPLAKWLRAGGGTISCSGFLVYGLPTVQQYWRQAKADEVPSR